MTTGKRTTTGRGPAGFRNDEGAVAVIVAMLVVALIGFVALVVDVGSVVLERSKLQTAADAAALAGVRDLPDKGLATTTARRYSTLNAPEAPVVTVAFFSGEVAVTDSGVGHPTLADASAGLDGATLVPACYTPPIEESGFPDTVQVTVSNPATPLYFARIWNMSSTQVSASARARIKSLTMSGVLPIAVIARNASGSNFGFTVGTEQDMQEGAGPGNYGWMTMNDPPVEDPGNNDKWQKDEFIDCLDGNGTDYPVYTTLYPALTGEKTPDMRAFQAWYDRGNRLGIFPIVSGSGPGSKNVRVIGFARLRIVARPAKNEIRGVFEHAYTEEEMEPAPYWPDAGLQKVTLVR